MRGDVTPLTQSQPTSKSAGPSNGRLQSENTYSEIIPIVASHVSTN